MISSSLSFKIKPMSLNNAYIGYRRNYSWKARQHRAKFFTQIMSIKNQIALERIRGYFDMNKHSLEISFDFQQPQDILFTKKGYISRRSMDIDNCLKLVTDYLCGSKYDNDWLNARDKREATLYKIDTLQNLAIDDQFITTIHASKSLSPDANYYLIINISIVELPQV